ncbi:hypothetical protein P3S67_013496 [Capsicum chacoense]
MLNSNTFVASRLVSLRWLVCGIVDVTSWIKQMNEMHRAWASGLPPSPFPTIDPTNNLNLPSKSQSQFLIFVDAIQHELEFLSSQKHPNASITLPLSSQYKPATLIAPHTACVFVTQPSVEISTFAINRIVKSSLPEELEKMVGKMKSAENARKSSLGPVGKKDVSYIDWGMSSSVNRPPILEILKLRDQDGHKEFMKYLVQYCNQLREPGGKKNEKDDTNILVGERAHPRRRCHHCCQSQGQVHTQALHNHSQNPFSLFRHLHIYKGHSIEDCRDLKREIEKMIQDGSIMVLNIDSEESSSHVDM